MFEAVIGIEVHCELMTQTKMFSGAALGYGARPNTHINEIDISMPGTLPSLNKEAVKYGVMLSKALNLEIDPLLRFDRKNYFYSDLPKGYQITQNFYPLGKNGAFEINVDGEPKTIRINRLHLEEDTAQQIHEGDNTQIDFNRAGTPLVEIVTEADFRSGKEAKAYIEALRQLVIYLGVSDGKMAEGSLRCDVNISLRPIGEEKFGTKVEVKNLNSLNNIQKAIDYEMNRQEELLLAGETITSQTLRFDEETQTTVVMRDKETTVDYRYFVDPNIPPTHIPNDILEIELPELPKDKKKRYQTEYELSEYDVDVLMSEIELVHYFDQVAPKINNSKLTINWLTQELISLIGEKPLENIIKPEYFISFIDALDKKTINSKQAKEVYQELMQGKDPKQVIKDKGMVQISDEGQLLAWIEEVLASNPSIIEDYKNGLDKSIKFVVGQVMKNSKGKANPALTNKLVVATLDKHKEMQ